MALSAFLVENVLGTPLSCVYVQNAQSKLGPFVSEDTQQCLFVSPRSEHPPRHPTSSILQVARALWSWSRLNSPPPPPRCRRPPSPSSSHSGPRTKGRASILSPCRRRLHCRRRRPTPRSRAAKPTTRSPRTCCSWPKTRARTARRRRRRRAKEGARTPQVEAGDGGGDGWIFCVSLDQWWSKWWITRGRWRPQVMGRVCK